MPRCRHIAGPALAILALAGPVAADQRASAPHAPQPAAAAPNTTSPSETAKPAAAEPHGGTSAAQASLQAQLDQVTAENASLKSLYQRSADAGRALAGENDRLKDQLASLTRLANACQTKNDRLIAFAEALLADYDRIGLREVFGSREPFLGLKRVQLENAAQDREDQVRAERCDPRIDGKPATAGAKSGGGS